MVVTCQMLPILLPVSNQPNIYINNIIENVCRPGAMNLGVPGSTVRSEEVWVAVAVQFRYSVAEFLSCPWTATE